MAGSSELKVNLTFHANADQARKVMKDLQTELNKLTSDGLKLNSGLGINKELLDATATAQQLKLNLQQAFNTSTGKLDIVSFTSAMKQAGQSAESYRNALMQLGPSGKQAFAQLQQQIVAAEAPLTRVNSKMADLATSLKNTVKWQLSSSMLHGFMSSINQAFSYAQNLNGALNDIRIVTGASADEMANFASQANLAAKALSTSTKTYADAALIFYQQGLKDADVKERTDAVIKMANVTKDSADKVSSYMTAIWNNFDDGSASLEHYADVMTALGAATASSTAEIAAGLEKFASIGKTIGLSYDYATSALATIVSQTRQSADVVGTGLRTIFSRLQGLSLGETLEDGVDLNKYSKALSAVGVQILDATGNMKNMDTILESLADKWTSLSSAQKTALAQTVGGVRQYTTLISLMDNWKSMESNLATAQSSAGTLQQQADIYAESWDAAKQRVKASAEAIYSSLLNDEFFISMNNGIAGILDQVNSLIDGLGGLKGVLLSLTPIILNAFGGQISNGINTMVTTLSALTPKGRQRIQDTRTSMMNATTDMFYDKTTPGDRAMAQYYQSQNRVQAAYMSSSKNMTEFQKAQAQSLMQRAEVGKAKLEQSATRTNDADKRTVSAGSSFRAKLQAANIEPGKQQALIDRSVALAEQAQREAVQKAGATSLSGFKIDDSSIDKAKAKLQDFIKTLRDNAGVKFSNGFESALVKLQGVLEDTKTDAKEVKKALDEVVAAEKADMDKAKAEKTDSQSQGAQLAKDVKEAQGPAPKKGEKTKKGKKAKPEKDTRISADETVKEITAANKEFGESTGELVENLHEVKEEAEHTEGAMKKMGEVDLTFGGGVTALASTFMSVGSAVSSLIGLFQVWQDDSVPVVQKIATSFMSLGMVVLSLSSAFTASNKSLLGQMILLPIVKAGWFGTAEAQAAAATGAKITGISFTKAGISGMLAGIKVQIGWWPLLLIFAAIATAIGIIIGLMKVFESLSNAYNADAIAAEKAAEAARNLANAYGEAKDKYQEMVDTMDQYASARAALDSLTEGTQEYSEALSQANELALDLIANNPSLVSGEDYRWENGQLIIDEDAMERVKQNQAREVAELKAASIMADAEAKAAKAKADQTALVRSNNDEVMNASAGIGTAIGLILTAINPAIGALVAGVGLLAGAVINDFQDLHEQAQIDELTEKYKIMGEEAFSAQEMEALGFDTANQKYIESVQEVVKATVAASEQASQAARLAAEEVLSTQQSYNRLNDDRQDRVGTASGRVYDALEDKYYKEYLDAAGDRGWFNTGTGDSEEAFFAYAQKMGLKDVQVTNYSGSGDDSTVKYKYTDDNGDTQEAEVTAKQMARVLAAQAASEALAESTVSLIAVFNDLESSASKADKALSDFLGGSLKDATRGEINDLFGGASDISSIQSRNYLNRRFGGEDHILSDEEAILLGFESADAMVKAFEQQYEDAMKSWSSIKLPALVDDLGLGDGLSLATAQSLENTITDLNLGPKGEQAGLDFINGLNSMLKDANVSSEDQTDVLSALIGIDWSDWDAMEQAAAILESFGYELDYTSSSWITFAQNMRIASRSVPNFASLKQDIIDVYSILNDLDFGGVISEEDYQTLVKYESKWRDLFILQADGSRKFIGDSEAMAEATAALINRQKALLDIYQNVAEVNDGEFTTFDWDNGYKDTETVKSFEEKYLASPELQALLNQHGYDSDSISSILSSYYETGDYSALQPIFTLIGDALDPVQLEQMGIELEEMLASTASTVEELDALHDLGEDNGGIGDKTYRKALIAMASEYEYCTGAIEDYQAALATGDAAQIAAAESALKNSINVEKEAEAYNTMYANAMSGKDSMSLEDLRTLKEANEELYNDFLTMSDEDWYRASYEAYSAWLTQRMSGYDEDSAEYKSLMMEKRQVDEEYYDYLQEKDKEAYDTIMQAWKDKNESIQDAVDALSIFEDGTTYGEQSFEAIEKLRQSLLATGKTAEEVDQILKNLGKDETKDDVETVWAAAQEQARLLLTQAVNNKETEIATDPDVHIIIKGVKNESPKVEEVDDGYAPKTTDGEVGVKVTGGDFAPSANSSIGVNGDGTLILKIPAEGTSEEFTVSVDDSQAFFKGGTIVPIGDGEWGIQWSDELGRTYTATVNDAEAFFSKGEVTQLDNGKWGIKWSDELGRTYTATIDDTNAFFGAECSLKDLGNGKWGIEWSDDFGRTYSATLSTVDGFTGSALYYNSADSTWGVNFSTDTGETFTATLKTNPIEDPNWAKYLESTDNGFQLKLVNRATGEQITLALDDSALAALATGASTSSYLAYEDGGFKLKTNDASIKIVPILDLTGTGFSLENGHLTYETEDGTILSTGEGAVLGVNADGTGALTNGSETSTLLTADTVDALGLEGSGLTGSVDAIYYNADGDIIVDAAEQGLGEGTNFNPLTATEIAELYDVKDLVTYDTWIGSGYNFFEDFEKSGKTLLEYAEQVTLDTANGPMDPATEMLLYQSGDLIKQGGPQGEVMSGVIEAIGQSKFAEWKTADRDEYWYGDAYLHTFGKMFDTFTRDLYMMQADISEHDEDGWLYQAYSAMRSGNKEDLTAIFSPEAVLGSMDLDDNDQMDEVFQTYFDGMLNEFEADPDAINRFVEDLTEMFNSPYVSNEMKAQGYFLVQGLLSSCADSLGNNSGIADALEGLLAMMRGVLGIQSPSKKTMEMGRWLAKGLEEGANSEDIDLSPLAEKALKSIEDTLKAKIASGTFSDIISDALNLTTYDDSIFEETDWNKVDQELGGTGVTRQGTQFFDGNGTLITASSNPFAWADLQTTVGNSTYDPSQFLQLSSGKYVLRTDATRLLADNNVQVIELDSGGFQIQDSDGNPLSDTLFTNYEQAFGRAVEGIYTEKAMTAYFSKNVDPNFTNYTTDKTLTAVQKGMISSIMSDALENATADTGVAYANWDELVNAVGFESAMGYLNQAYADHNVQFLNDTEMIWAQINDIMVNAVSKQIAIEDEAAQKVVDIWLSAFSAILAARELMISGTSFAEGLDSDSMLALIGQYAGTGMSPQQIVAEFFKTSGQNLPEFTMDYNSPESRSFIDSHLRYGANGEVLSTPLLVGPNGKLITAGNADYATFEAGVRGDLHQKITTGMGSASYQNILNNQQIAAMATSGDVEGAIALARLISPDLTTAEIETLLAGAVDVDTNGNTVWRNTIDPEAAVDRYIAQQFGKGGLAQAYQDAVTGRIQSDINYRQTLSSSANTSAETYITGQQEKVDLVSKAREAMLNGKDLSYALTPEEQAQLLELTGKADLASVSLDSLDTATMTLTNTMMLCAQQIAVAMGMIERGEADGFSIDPETGKVTVTKTTSQTDWDTVDENLGGMGVFRVGENYFQNGQMITATSDADTWKTIQDVVAAATTEVVEEVALSGAASTNTSDAVEEAGSAGEVESQNTRLQYAQDAGFGSLEEQDEYIEYLTTVAEKMQTVEELTADDRMTTEEALKVQQKYANQLKKMEKAYERAIDEGDKYVEVLNDANSTAAEQVDAIDNLKQIYGDVLGPMEGVSNEFLKSADNMKLLQQAAQGDEEALNKLQVAYVDALTPNVDFTPELEQLAAEVAAWDPGDLEIGATIDDTDFLSKCEALITNAGLTADQASAALSAMGVDAQIKEHKVWVPDDPETVKITGSVPIYKPDGSGVQGYENVSAEIVQQGEGHFETWYTIEGATYNGKGVTHGGGGNSHRRGGGGGGGGGRREARRANHVKKDDYVERYHEIDNVIDDLADAYERLNSQEDRAWGKNRIDAMKAQTAIIKQQVAATEEKIRQAEQYLKLDKKAAEAAGWLFDENGNVMNYDELMSKQVDKYNSAIDAYNNMSADEQEKLDEKWSKKKNADGEYYSGYEDYLKQTLLDGPKEALEQYEETMELLEDLGMDYDEFLNTWHDNIIGQIQTKLDTTLEVTESQLEYLDHKLSRISDDAYKTAEALTMMAQQMEVSSTQFDANKSALNDLLQAYNENWTAESLMNGDISIDDLVSAGMESGDIELLQNIMSGLMDASAQMSEQMVNSIESMANAFDEFNADMDRYISTIEHAQAITSTYRNIIDLTGRTMSGFNSSMLKSINDATVAQAKANLSSNKTKYDTVKVEYEEAKKAYEAAQASYAEGGIDAAALKAAKDTYQAAQDNMNEAQENFLSSWEAALQAAADAFQSNMEAAMRDVGEMMSGHLAGGLAELEDQFAKLSEQDQNYVDDYEKIYQLTKMTRDLTDKIDNTSNVRAQKELLKYQKEINGLLESDQQMSQYDIDYLRKKIDLKMAEIALDEAQSAKSQVTMRRDSEGNYNYVYTADENAVEKAESDYADRLYEMQKANDEYITSLSENMANLSSQMLSEIAAIDTTIYDTEEKYQAEVQRITDHYTNQMAYYNEEMNKVLGNNKTLYEQDWTNFSKYTGYKLSAEENYVTKWNQTVLSQVTGFETQEGFYQNFNEAIFGSDPAHPSSDSLIGKLVTAYVAMRQQINEANEAAGVDTEDLASTILGNIQAATDEAEQAATDITNAAGQIVTQITSIGSAVTTMVNNYSDAMEQMEAETDAMLGVLLDFLAAYGEIGDLDIDPGILAEINRRRQERQNSGNPASMDTGGYTGSWGNEGRLALLHQKELVLNASDTANMLASVGILRQIANVIDLNALASSGGFGHLVAGSIGSHSGTLQQEVHIEANFPNATDKNQIEDAFKDIVNLAAQFANR